MMEDIDHRLTLWLAPPVVRPQLGLLLALEARLRAIDAATREPLLADIKRAWWGERLGELDSGVVPAEPLLVALHDVITPAFSGAMLARLANRDEQDAALASIIEALAGPQSPAYRFWISQCADDASRAAAGRPLASPAARCWRALRFRLIGR